MRGRLGRTLLGAIGALVVVGIVTAGYLLYFDRPSPPPSLAGQAAFARTTLQSPDPLETPPTEAASWIVATECQARVTGGNAYVDLCWTATRQRDEDPSEDHYTLHVGGTFGGGARWLIVEAHPLEPGPLLRTEGLPRGRVGGCQPMNFGTDLVVGSTVGVQLCGSMDAGPGADAGVWHVNWVCEPCVPFDETDRPIEMQLQVAVEQGTIPNWDLKASVGR